MWKRVLLAACLLSVAACERVKIQVNCVTAQGPVVNCDVKEVQGKGKAEACWDFTVECANGNKVTMPRSCQTVKDGGSATLTIPGNKLTGVEKCDKPTKATVANLTINGEKAQ